MVCPKPDILLEHSKIFFTSIIQNCEYGLLVQFSFISLLSVVIVLYATQVRVMSSSHLTFCHKTSSRTIFLGRTIILWYTLGIYFHIVTHIGLLGVSDSRLSFSLHVLSSLVRCSEFGLSLLLFYFTEAVEHHGL